MNRKCTCETEGREAAFVIIPQTGLKNPRLIAIPSHFWNVAHTFGRRSVPYFLERRPDHTRVLQAKLKTAKIAPSKAFGKGTE